jgi:uroporphyrin-III C-methyltransferase
MTGKVYLVGAGPGDPELITIRGAKVLGLAEVVVYDALVHEGVLSHAPKSAKLIYMGKRGGRVCPSQADINDTLVREAKEGRVVVRLKGGDPFIFGRGGEELLALAEAGIPCEAVPGITSGSAVPGALGIPLTHRGASGSVAFVTGHPGTGLEDPVDWEGLSTSASTIVIYMGLTRLSEIAQRMVAAGRSADTPVAVISQGTEDGQRHVISTLGGVYRAVEAAGIHAPAIIIVGEVVGLREKFGTLAGVLAESLPTGQV